jgi:glycerophosphoryl diester phosphodiesterase
VLRVGHRGAAALAPQNTIESVRAALDVGVDMIEFDVSPGLVVAHDPGRPGPRLDAFLNELVSLLPGDVELMVDLKATGYELATLEKCRRAGLLDRCLFATGERSSIRVLQGKVRTSFSFSRGSPGRALPLLRLTVGDVWRRSGADDATVRHTLITPRLIDVVHHREGRVFAWTVNTAEGVARMRALGVDGVISDDPRLLNAG